MSSCPNDSARTGNNHGHEKDRSLRRDDRPVFELNLMLMTALAATMVASLLATTALMIAAALVVISPAVESAAIASEEISAPAETEIGAEWHEEAAMVDRILHDSDSSIIGFSIVARFACDEAARTDHHLKRAQRIRER